MEPTELWSASRSFHSASNPSATSALHPSTQDRAFFYSLPLLSLNHPHLSLIALTSSSASRSISSAPRAPRSEAIVPPPSFRSVCCAYLHHSSVCHVGAASVGRHIAKVQRVVLPSTRLQEQELPVFSLVHLEGRGSTAEGLTVATDALSHVYRSSQ